MGGSEGTLGIFTKVTLWTVPLPVVKGLVEFEDEFDMNIPDEEAEKIQTVGAAVDYVVNLIKSKSKE